MGTRKELPQAYIYFASRNGEDPPLRKPISSEELLEIIHRGPQFHDHELVNQFNGIAEDPTRPIKLPQPRDIIIEVRIREKSPADWGKP